MGEALLWTLDRAVHELALFAAVGILIIGIDDCAIDLIWIGRTLWRRVSVYARHPRADATGLAARLPGRIAVFVPAWSEAEVIGPMLRTALERWAEADVRLYVGCYPNDRATLAAVAAIRDPRVRLVVNARPGPTTKADNLNAMWRALRVDERRDGPVKAIALHDAEDVVHPAEIRLFDALIERFDFVQLPVLPLIERGRGSWARAISSTYADEFAEAHLKTLVVREAIGAGLPSAGVGCAFARPMLEQIAARHGAPFDQTSVTEDYELGLRIAEAGGRGAFVTLPGRPGGRAVAVRAHFPDTLDASVRQKARWLAGIALSGWTRLGWRGGLAERWMRWRDRRAILAALVLVAAYLSMLGWTLLATLGRPPAAAPAGLFAAGLALLLWRLCMRVGFVWRAYGWAEALLSVPRIVLGNVIAIAASRRALIRYIREARGHPLVWDKTGHRFPEVRPAE